MRSLPPITGQQSELSGVHLVDDGLEAFALRLRLLQQAEHGIDAQYYMWHADLTGQLLLAEMLAAADRGVQVHLLLDDVSTAGLDDLLHLANAHQNLEVRLFNPFMMRKPRWPNYLFNFRRLNRRMHNKSLTIDGVATVVGGRNIGDEYFNAHAGFQFADMDVLVVGAVVSDVAAAFEDYWNCASAFPLNRIVAAPPQDLMEQCRTRLTANCASTDAETYLQKLEHFPLLKDGHTPAFEWTDVKLVVDNPAKGQGDIPRRNLLVTGLRKALGAAEHSILVATAYFVPGRLGQRYLIDAARAGKQVRVLTNSLASNDVLPVHAGYARYRKRMLRGGVKLLELMASRDTAVPGRRRKKRLPHYGASSSSLHAKVFVMDEARVFVGSFNFDPRSVYLNCEMGLLIESHTLGLRLTEQFNALAQHRCYRPFIESGNRLAWRDSANTIHHMEPESKPSQRVLVWLISWLPVEWLL